MEATDFNDITCKHNFDWGFAKYPNANEQQRVYAIYKDGLQTITQADLANEAVCHGIIAICNHVYNEKDNIIPIAIQACCCGNDKELQRLFATAVKEHDFTFIQEIINEKHTEKAIAMFPNINSFVKAVHSIHTKPHETQEIIYLLCLAMKDDGLIKVSFALLQTIASPCQLYSILKPLENATTDMKKVLLHLESLYCVKNYAKRHHTKFSDTPYVSYNEKSTLKYSYNVSFVNSFPNANKDEKETLYEMVCAEDKNFYPTSEDLKSKVIMCAFVKHLEYIDKNRCNQCRLKAIELGDIDIFKQINFDRIWRTQQQIDEVLQAVISSKNAKFIVDCAKHAKKEWDIFDAFGEKRIAKTAFIKQLYSSAIDLNSEDAVVEMEKICRVMELYRLLEKKTSAVARNRFKQMDNSDFVVAIHFIFMEIAVIFAVIAILFVSAFLVQKMKPIDISRSMAPIIMTVACAFVSGFAWML